MLLSMQPKKQCRRVTLGKKILALAPLTFKKFLKTQKNHKLPIPPPPQPQHPKQNSPTPAPLVLEQKCSAPADRSIPKPGRGAVFSLLQAGSVKGTALLCSPCCDSNTQAGGSGISAQLWPSLPCEMRTCSSCLCPGFDLL